MRYLIWLAILFTGIPAEAQAPAAAPRFDVASVKPVAEDATSNDRAAQLLRSITGCLLNPGEIPLASPDRIRLKGCTLLDLIAIAYKVRATQISGPQLLSQHRFDIDATMPVDTPKEALHGMLQSLLEERFGLKVHHATKTAKGFALIVGKNGPHLQPAAPPAPPPDPSLTQEEKHAQEMKSVQAMMAHMRELRQPGGAHTTDSRTWATITTEELAAYLEKHVEGSVVDATQLSGKYAVTLEFSEGSQDPVDTIFDAVEKLGLKLQAQTVTVDEIVVDQVSSAPTAN